ncbi:MAG: rhodanese-like domain-containing protein, partial [Thermoleophilia bacterium]
PFSRGAAAAVPSIDVNDAFARSKRGAKLIDVRSPAEFRGSHPRGARNVPPALIKQEATGLARDDELLVICLSGHRSPRHARALVAMGYTNVTHVHGGLLAWKKAGLPLKK